MAERPGQSWERGLDVSRKKKRSHLQLARNTQQHEQTGRAASHTRRLPLQITHAQGDKTRGASAPREEREGREMEGKLDTGTLCNELVSVSDWRKLGLYLGLQDYELDQIQRSRPAEGCDGWKRETFSLWLQRIPSASWRDVVRALQQMGEKTVAERIEHKYIQKGPPSTGTSSITKPESPSFTNPPTAAVVQRNIVMIQGKFSTLVTTSCTRLRGRNINIEDFQTHLITMYSSPNSRDGTGTVTTVVESAKSLDEIFRALSKHKLWDYLNYYLLQSIIEQFAGDDDELKTVMEQYQKDLTGHILTLKIQTYLDATNYEPSADEKLPALPPPNIFKKLSVKVKANITEHSLSYVYELWRSLAIQFDLPQPAMILHDIAEGCLGIIWLLPTNLVKYVTEMAQGSLDMFARQHIQRVMLEEQCIYPMEFEPPLPEFETTALKMKPNFNADEHPFEKVNAGAQPSNPKQDVADELKSYEICNVEALLEDKHVKGRGSFGAVYEVKANGVPCIAKRLHDILQGYGQHEAVSTQEKKMLCENFRRECIILSRLRHPNIVQFLGVCYGKREGDLMLLMEYLHMDLDHCLTDNPNMPLPIKISILLDVSYGLLYLHTQTPVIIHRDLKAGNVLLTTDMQAKLADLGVAKIIDLMTCKQSHTFAPGTNAVMPPEALQEKPHYNDKLDVFSFGTLTLHVVTQKFPTVHEVPFEYIEKVEKGKMQIAKRMSVIREMSQDHCLYPLAMECLLDDQKKRPTTQSLNVWLKRLSEQHPRQFHDFLHMHRELQKQQETQKKLEKEMAESKSRSLHEMLKQQEMQKKLEKEMAESKSRSLHEIRILRRELKDKQDEVQWLTKQVKQRGSEVIQMRFTCQELQQKINLLEKQVSKSTNKLLVMEEETSRLKAFNQDSIYRCEHLESILEERTSLIKKYQQSSSHRYKKLEEAASHARKQIEHLQTVLIEATQQEAEEIQTPASCNQLQLQPLTSYNKETHPVSSRFSLRKLTPPGTHSVVLLSLHDNKLKLNEEAILLLRDIKKPVAILTICGPYRSGKSYFLSQLLGSPDAFKVGHTIEPCTHGVWMGTTALECEEFVLLLLDTEGTDAIGDFNSVGVFNLLVMTTLLSSCLIYNSTGVPRSKDLQKMSCFTHLSTALVQDDSKQEHLAHLKKYFPDFVWLIRNQAVKLQKDENGNPQTWTQYIKAKVLVQSEKPCYSASDEVVRVMLHLFPSLECKVIPHPFCDNPAETPKEVSPKFNAAIKEVVQQLLSSVKLKPGLSASLDGSMVANLAQEYVKALNSGENIIIEGSLYATIIQKLEDLTEELVQQYRMKMVEILDPKYPLEEGTMDDEEHPPTTLMAFHQQVFEECKLILTQKADFYMPTLNTAPVDAALSNICRKKMDILTKFKKCVCEYEATGGLAGQRMVLVRGELHHFVTKNKERSSERCRLLFDQLVEQENDVRLTKLEEDYMAKAVGPAKEKVFKQKAQWISGQPEDVMVAEMTWRRPIIHTDAAWNYEVQRKIEGNEWINSGMTPDMHIVITDLKPNVKYHLRVHGVCIHMHGNKGEWSEELTVTTPPGKPNKPQKPIIRLKSSTTATILIQQLQPNDDNGSEITDVIVESKLQDTPLKVTHFPVEPHGNIKDTHMTKDLPLDCVTCDSFYSYHFRVSMKNSVGESEPSDWTIIPTSELIPGPPQDINSDNGMYQITLRWSQPNIHPFAVKTYEVQSGTITGVWHVIAETQSDLLTAAVKNLKPNTKYRFRVRAVNENKEGESSEVYDTRTSPGVPSKPSKPEVTITAPQMAIVTVQRLNKEDENGSPVTHVIIEKRAVGDHWSSDKFEADTSMTLIKNDIVLQNCMQCFRIRMKNDIGVSDPSDIFQAPYLIPGLPQNFQEKENLWVTGTLHNKITVSWDKPDAQPQAVKQYEVEMQQEGSSQPTYQSVEKLIATFSNLKPITVYSFRVRGKNEAKYGEWSDVLEIKSAPGPPCQPSKPVIEVVSARKVLININKLTEEEQNGSHITLIKIEECSATYTNWKLCCSRLPMDTGPPEIQIGIQLANNACYFRVVMVNGIGESKPSEWVAVPEKDLIPGPPQNVEFSKVTCNEIQLCWKMPFACPRAAKQFEVEMKANGESLWTHKTTVPCTKMCASFKNLDPDTDYWFRVCAKNGNQEGKYSQEVSQKTDPGPPNRPSKPDIQVLSDQKATITVPRFNKKDENGSPVTQLIVQVCTEEDPNAEWTDYEKPFPMKCDRVIKKDIPLKDDSFYFRVLVENEVCRSEPSDHIEVPAHNLVPGKPQKLDVTDVSHDWIKIKWDKPHRFSRAVTHYEVEFKEVGGEWKKMPISQKSDRSVQIPNLKPNTKYRFKIVAVNQNRRGEYSDELTKETHPGPPNRPSKPDPRLMVLCITVYTTPATMWNNSTISPRKNLSLLKFDAQPSTKRS